jgi:hypothetical protein
MNSLETMSSEVSANKMQTVQVSVALPSTPTGTAVFTYTPSAAVTLNGSGKVAYIMQTPGVAIVGGQFMADEDNCIKSAVVSGFGSTFTIKASYTSPAPSDHINFKLLVASTVTGQEGILYESQDPQIIINPEV